MSTSKNNKAYSVEEIRKKHPKAYDKWSEQEDSLLIQMFRQGKSIDELSVVFQRGEGAIRSRLNKLDSTELIDYTGFSRANHLLVNFPFDWIPVLRSEDEVYLFPNSITPFMSRLYKSPAVYRWNIYKNILTYERIVYIGEGQQLIPSRINGYLNPGPSQATNKRLNIYFHEHIESGYKVQLEVVRFDEVTLGNLSLRQSDLKNRHFRRFLEHMLITYYQQKGYTLLNR